jgi:hypothetical protein
MLAPGVYSLGDLVVTSPPAAAQAGTAITGLGGILRATLQVRFLYGSGGTSGTHYVQTTLDQGQTWIDIAAITFTTASKNVVLNFSALTPRTSQLTPSDGALAADTALDGVLGDQFRTKTIWSGTYAGQSMISTRLVLG